MPGSLIEENVPESVPPEIEDGFSFNSLDEDEKKLFISLPYRVGYWISQSDRRGGDESDTAELETLSSLIISYAQDMCKSEFMQGLMEQTVKSKSDWKGWQKEVEKVPDECDKAASILKGRLNDKELLGFKENLFEIALSVAGAYREEDLEVSSIAGKLNEIVDRVLSIFGRDSELNFGNISSTERAALGRLRKVLII